MGTFEKILCLFFTYNIYTRNGVCYNNFMTFAIFVSVFLAGVSLAADAFAVSICDGMVYRDLTKRKAVLIPLTFGFFQAAMPIIGFYVGLLFLEQIEAFDHWIAFALLVFIGGKMIFDGIKELRAKKKGEEPPAEFKLTLPALLIQAIATSIDALIVGVSFAALPDVNIWTAVFLIGLTTFAISLAGVFFGKKFGQLLGSRAEILGGVILVAIGLKVFIEHTFFGG